jgi:hypothetical protein
MIHWLLEEQRGARKNLQALDNYVYMIVTVYFLAHKDTQRRLKWYRTLAGARIAQRTRNHRLGFHTRIERIELWDNLEAEQCLMADGSVQTATYVIQEDSIEVADLT